MALPPTHGRLPRAVAGLLCALVLVATARARADEPEDEDEPKPPAPIAPSASVSASAAAPVASSAGRPPSAAPPPAAASADAPRQPAVQASASRPEPPVPTDAVAVPKRAGPTLDLPPMPRAASRYEEETAAMVASRRPLDPAEAAIKKRGVYVTGLPLANFDPNFGVGFGVRGNVFDNGPSTDPLFRYAPYKRRLSITLFATTGGLQFHWLDYDAPFVSGSPYRLRAQLVFEQNIDRHYFGIGERSQGKLSYPGEGRSFGKLDDYEASQRRVLANGTTYSRYDRFFFRRPIGFFSVERSLFGGRVRPLAGVAISHSTVRDLAGEAVSADGDVDAISAPTRLGEDCARGAIVGCRGGFYNYVRLGVAYDTRDFEPDPTSGVFLDAEANLGTKALGSRYTNAVVLGAARGYFSPFRKLAKIVLAGRAVYQVASAGTPFYALNVLPFTEDPKTGLGGFRTVRGFSQDRFVGPVMAIANAEIRWTFASFDAARQHFGLMLVPFVDFGRVFDRVENTTWKGFQRGQGAGFRVAWNQATIVMLDYGTSREGSALYVNFGHIF